MKMMIQKSFSIEGQRSPNETPIQKRSPSGARAEPERSRGLQKNAQKQDQIPNRARVEPERIKNSERITGLRKNVRAPETTLFRDRRISRHPGRLNALSVYQTSMILPIYMGTSTVALCKIDPVLWIQTLMSLHPVEAHFHTA